MPDLTHDGSVDGDLIPQEVAGLPDAVPPVVIRLDGGDQLPLPIGPVRVRITRRPVRMLASGDSIPSPLLGIRPGTFSFDVLEPTRAQEVGR